MSGEIPITMYASIANGGTWINVSNAPCGGSQLIRTVVDPSGETASSVLIVVRDGFGCGSLGFGDD